MKHRELFNTADYPPGFCVSCGVSLKGRATPGLRTAGAPRRVVCGLKECTRTYYVLRRARIVELARLGLEVEARRA